MNIYSGTDLSSANCICSNVGSERLFDLLDAQNTILRRGNRRRDCECCCRSCCDSNCTGRNSTDISGGSPFSAANSTGCCCRRHSCC